MAVVRIATHRVELSNLGKALFPEAEISKGEVIDYYRQVAGAAAHPEALPDGIGKKGFIQQSRSRHFPSWIEGVSVCAAMQELEALGT